MNFPCNTKWIYGIEKPHIVMVNGQWTVRMRPQPTPLDKARYRMYKQAHSFVYHRNLAINSKIKTPIYWRAEWHEGIKA